MTVTVFDPTPCALGEGAFWHPERGALFWFDILKFRLRARAPGDGGAQSWTFPEHVSAAGVIDRDRLLIASETALSVFDLTSGESTILCPLEASRPDTRSNDGRADPWGGFWIGTMSKTAATGQGAIYRYYRGELRRIVPGLTIPNAIAFHPDGTHATWTDTRDGRIWRHSLSDRDGWPVGQPDPWIDLRGDGLAPDGAVFDAGGNLWNAQWGAGRVACYGPDGTLLHTVAVDAPHTTCPAFGGADGRTLYCTTARQGLSSETLADGRPHGATFQADCGAAGDPDPRVIP